MKLKQYYFFLFNVDVKNVIAFKLNHSTFLYKYSKIILKVLHRFVKWGING